MENQATEPIIEFLDVKKEYFLYKNEKARFKAIFTKKADVALIEETIDRRS